MIIAIQTLKEFKKRNKTKQKSSQPFWMGNEKIFCFEKLLAFSYSSQLRSAQPEKSQSHTYYFGPSNPKVEGSTITASPGERFTANCAQIGLRLVLWWKDSPASDGGFVGGFINVLSVSPMGPKSPRSFMLEDTPLPRIYTAIPLIHFS